MRAAVGRLYVEQVPARVVQDFQNSTIGTGNKGGAKGAAILDLETQLNTLPGEWAKMASDLSQVEGAIKTTRLAIAAAGIQDGTQTANLAMQQIGVQGQMAQSVIGVVAAAGTGGRIGRGVSWQLLHQLGSSRHGRRVGDHHGGRRAESARKDDGPGGADTG